MSRLSKAAEDMFQEILTAAGFSDERRRFPREQLLALARKERPGTLKHASRRYEDRGWTLNWEVAQPKFILDECFAVDALTDAQGDGRLYSFDITLNPARVAHKEEKFTRLSHCYNTLGIIKSAVILVVWSKGPRSFASLSEEKQEYLIDFAYRIVGDMQASPSRLTNHTITI